MFFLCFFRYYLSSPQVPNGNILSGFGPVYDYNDSVLFSCKKGYILNGSNLIHCGADDEWHPSPPTCELSEYAPKDFHNWHLKLSRNMDVTCSQAQTL